MNNLEEYADIFSGLTPFKGYVPKDFGANAFGCLGNQYLFESYGKERPVVGDREMETELPSLNAGEFWFEAVNWVETAREASGRYVMMTLGACFGAQAIGAYKVLQMVNPMPSKLVLVEPEPENFKRMTQNLTDNSIDPDDHWLVNTAITGGCDPAIFPVGAPGSGSQNCFLSNSAEMREQLVDVARQTGAYQQYLENILRHNKTGLQYELFPGQELSYVGELAFVSAISLRELLGPFDFIDYLEADLQQSEIQVFPPFIEQLTKKVRRIHLGTHGQDTHDA